MIAANVFILVLIASAVVAWVARAVHAQVSRMGQRRHKYGTYAASARNSTDRWAFAA